MGLTFRLICGIILISKLEARRAAVVDCQGCSKTDMTNGYGYCKDCEKIFCNLCLGNHQCSKRKKKETKTSSKIVQLPVRTKKGVKLDYFRTLTRDCPNCEQKMTFAEGCLFCPNCGRTIKGVIILSDSRPVSIKAANRKR